MSNRTGYFDDGSSAEIVGEERRFNGGAHQNDTQIGPLCQQVAANEQQKITTSEKKKVNKQLKTTVLWTDFFNVNQFEKENGTFLHCVRGLRRWWCVSHDSSKSRSPDASAKFPSCRIKGESISIRHSLDESTIPPIQVQVEIVNQNQDVIEITQLP